MKQKTWMAQQSPHFHLSRPSSRCFSFMVWVGTWPSISLPAQMMIAWSFEISWLFTETEQDCQWVLSDFFSGLDLKDNNGLSYIANALLQEMEKQVSQLPAHFFQLGLGLEYVSQMGKVNPYILDMTGFDLDLSAINSSSSKSLFTMPNSSSCSGWHALVGNV